MAQVTARRRLGRTAVEVTELGFGGASIGELFVRVPEADAQATIAAAWDLGVRYFDTAPRYGRGLSELRTGAGLRDHPRTEYALSTKVGRWLRPASSEGFDGSPWVGGAPNEVVFDYTYDGIMRSVEQSRLRLAISRFDVAFIHDSHGMALGEAVARAGIKKRYYLETRGDVLLRNKEVFRFWKQLCVAYMFLGLEAIDEEGLKKYRKRVPLGRNFEALEFG